MILTLALEGGRHDEGRRQARADGAVGDRRGARSKQVEGAGFWYPALATVKEQVPDLVELAENADFEETVAFPTAFVAGNDVVADEPEKVDRVLKALREAIDVPHENTGRGDRSSPPRSQRLDPATVEADAGNVQVLSLEELDQLTEDGTVDTWLTGMVDYFVGAGKLTEPVDPAEFYTGDLFLQAGE